ncbi:hypothetical protein niasHT_036271 [Heterodera trifolii]|uniref:Uncharacterized protein n=1 Tax=Heterodera trifolii TaxID=157864 RepID=A0ABD2J4N3_9BILA
MEQPMPQMFGSNGMTNSSGPFSQVRDARLQFLRNILQKIKQHAEDIGFDGTMQVSIIEVEPQNGATAPRRPPKRTATLTTTTTFGARNNVASKWASNSNNSDSPLRWHFRCRNISSHTLAY